MLDQLEPQAITVGSRPARLFLGEGSLGLEVVEVPCGSRPQITELRSLLRRAPRHLRGMDGRHRPLTLESQSRPLFRATADHLRMHPATGASVEDRDRAADALEAPWGIRQEHQLHEVVVPDQVAPTRMTRSISDVVRELGSSPWKPPEPLDPIEENEVNLVVWMGVIETDTSMGVGHGPYPRSRWTPEQIHEDANRAMREQAWGHPTASGWSTTEHPNEDVASWDRWSEQL